MRRFFTDPENIIGDNIRIIEDASHITKVLRKSPGDKIIVFDGSGYEYTASLSVVNSKECLAKVIKKEFSACEPDIKVSLFQGLPKSDKMDLIVQKSVELGVYEITPVISERCVSKLNEKNSEVKIRRWNKISVEAAKQCGRGICPRVTSPLSFSDAVSKMKELSLAVMPYEVLGHEGEHGLKELLKKWDGKSIGILIGPEGGFSDFEAEFAKERGIYQVGLGRRILRTETVGSSLISIVMYEKDEI